MLNPQPRAPDEQRRRHQRLNPRQWRHSCTGGSLCGSGNSCQTWPRGDCAEHRLWRVAVPAVAATATAGQSSGGDRGVHQQLHHHRIRSWDEAVTAASVASVRNAFRLAAVLLREKKLKPCVWRDGSSPDIARFQAAAWGSWRVQQLPSPRMMVAARDAAPTSET